MASFYQTRKSCGAKTCKCRKGALHGPYWVKSVFLRTVNGQPFYKKIWLGKNLARGLFKLAAKEERELSLDRAGDIAAIIIARYSQTKEPVNVPEDFNAEKYAEMVKNA